MPNLKKEHLDIYNLLSSIQPFESGSNWLVDLCEMTNSAKHNNLTKTENTSRVSGPPRINIGGNAISVSGSAKNVVISNCEINGVNTGTLKIDKGNISQLAPPSKSLSIEFELDFVTDTIIKNKKGVEISLHPFLAEINQRMDDFINELYNSLILKQLI